ncbi:LysR family transcriptional regulator [Marinomonas sp. PE14-40]|uniref:LysR family transcriptional regulator n=1 Tax=Marinomonas sp. PE14-40 TaxID=3060621 RepID=UPI003F67A87D
MTPKQVRSLLTVIQYGSINQASKVLHLAPSSISAQLKELAIELEIDLFETKGRNIQLTQAGQSLLPSFQTFCAQELQIKQLAQTYQTGLKGSIRLFAPSSLCIYRLPAIIETLQVSEPELEIILIHEPYDYETALKQADIDAALIMTEVSNLTKIQKEWSSSLHLDEPIIYVAHPAYLTTQKQLSLEELNQYPLITTEEACSYRKSADKHFYKAGLTLSPRQSFSNVEVIKRCLIAKMGIGLLPECVVSEEITQGRLVKVPVAGAPYLFQSHIISLETPLINKRLEKLISRIKLS